MKRIAFTFAFILIGMAVFMFFGADDASAGICDDPIGAICSRMVWDDRNITQALNCGLISYNGEDAAYWTARRDMAKAIHSRHIPCETTPESELRASCRNYVSQFNVNAVDSEGIKCACDDPQCDSFFYWWCRLAPGSAEHCPEAGCQENDPACSSYIGGGGSDVTVPPAGRGPSGPSFTSGYEFVIQSFTFSLPSGEVNSIPDLLGRIGLFFYTLAFPIAVILIIWAGIIMLTSGGNQQRIALGKRTLKYTLIGLAAVIIARGFFTLVVDLLGI